MTRPRLALIAAIDRQLGIGRDGQLLWRESEDQKHFRSVTLGCPVIMGRKTWDSLPQRFRPLPGRPNIVVTRNEAWQAEGATVVHSLDDALAGCSDAPRVCVIGGADLFRLALPRADELVLTEIDASFDADTFFPTWDRAAFGQTSREDRMTASGIAYRFTTYERLKGS